MDIEALKGLALSYEDKLQKLFKEVESRERKEAWFFMKALGEEITASFRRLQGSILNLSDDESRKILMEMSKKFDEMLALFTVMSEIYYRDHIGSYDEGG